jgi:hypothetical protein
MERVGAADRVRAARTHRARDPGGGVGRDVRDGRGSLRPEGVEELIHGLGIPAHPSPQQPAGVMVDDDGEVLVAFLIGNLIDPDPADPGQAVVDRVDVGPDPGHDRPDGAPGDPYQRRHRGLGGVGGQPGHLVVEVEGVPGPGPGPRDMAGHHPAAGAGHSRNLRLDPHHQHSGVQVPPPPPARAAVIPRAPAQAPAASQALPSYRPRMRDDPAVTVQHDVFDHSIRQPEQPRPYNPVLHAVLQIRRFEPSTVQNPRSDTACTRVTPP